MVRHKRSDPSSHRGAYPVKAVVFGRDASNRLLSFIRARKRSTREDAKAHQGLLGPNAARHRTEALPAQQETTSHQVDIRHDAAHETEAESEASDDDESRCQRRRRQCRQSKQRCIVSACLHSYKSREQEQHDEEAREVANRETTRAAWLRHDARDARGPRTRLEASREQQLIRQAHEEAGAKQVRDKVDRNATKGDQPTLGALQER